MITLKKVLNVTNNTVVVTDPCYNAVGDFITIKNGVYDAIIDYYDDYTSSLTLVLAGQEKASNDSFHCITEIGVDSGLAGIYTCKPDLDEKKWSKFVEQIYAASNEIKVHKKERVLNGLTGITVPTGFGDGRYEVYEHTENDEITQLKIVFIRFN